jgi:hypothetical protein
VKQHHKYCLLLAAAVGLSGLFWFLSRDDEPSYEGRRLSYWLVAVTDYSRNGDPEHAAEAILQIGTNSIPRLLKYSRYAPSRWRLQANDSVGAWGRLLGFDWREVLDRDGFRAEGAVTALGLFGPQAAMAIPELTRFGEDAEHYERAKNSIFALGQLGPQALPSLMRVLTNAAPELRGMAG